MLLLTDINSRVPVQVGEARVPAILAGGRGSEPALAYLEREAPVRADDAVFTSGAGRRLSAVAADRGRPDGRGRPGRRPSRRDGARCFSDALRSVLCPRGLEAAEVPGAGDGGSAEAGLAAVAEAVGTAVAPQSGREPLAGGGEDAAPSLEGCEHGGQAALSGLRCRAPPASLPASLPADASCAMNAPPLLLRRRRAAALGLLWPPLSVFLLLLPEPALRAALPPASVPLLGLCALLHWAGRRSIALPVVFLLGLFADALYGAPLGLHGALFALAFAASGRRSSRWTARSLLCAG